MSEPKVEFDLNLLQEESPESAVMFDSLRRWHEFREDRGTPAMQTFEGSLVASNPNIDEIILRIPGEIYGYSGMSEISGNFWVPMTYSAAPQFDVCYFALETDNVNNDFLKVRLQPSSSTLTLRRYKVTIFYRGPTDGN